MDSSRPPPPIIPPRHPNLQPKPINYPRTDPRAAGWGTQRGDSAGNPRGAETQGESLGQVGPHKDPAEERSLLLGADL